MVMIKAVLFDLDGTLVDSLSDLALSTNFALKSLGFPEHKTEMYKYFVGDGMIKLIERALPDDKRSEEIISKCHEIFINHYRVHYADNLKVYDGICELLKELCSRGYRLAVISNKVQEMTSVIVSSLFPDVFDLAYGKQENFAAKPDGQLTLRAMEELAVKPCECIFVGDSGMDMKTALNTGAKPVGVLWGFRTRQELISSGAELLLNTPEELLKALGD